jgi:site-specific DNA-cytosine methylase
MEQVNHRFVREKLTCMKRKSPTKIDWIVVDAADYGIPQHRKRIIAGSPFLISTLRNFRLNKRKRCIRDVIDDPPRNFTRNSLYSRPDHRTGEMMPVPMKDQLRSIDKPSFTILAGGHLKWSDSEGNVLRHFRGDEAALIQTFPQDYKLPWNNVEALQGVGNAVPPLLAKILMTPTQ